jgi:hypothetical protein
MRNRFASLCKPSVLLPIVFAGTLWAQDPNSATSAFPFLTMSYDARQAAMAGASVAMPSGLAGFNANPAVLAYIERNQVALAYRTVVMDIWGGYVAAAFPAGNFGVISVNAIDLSEGTLSEVDESPADQSPVTTGNVWSSNSVAGGVSWARTVWETLALGVTLKGAYNRISSTGIAATPSERYSADGFAADIGAQYRLLEGRFISGLALRNIGALQSGYSTAADGYAMPFSASAGISYIPQYTPALRLALDLDKERDNYPSFEPAIEVFLIPKTLALRAGYAFSTHDLDYFLSVLGGNSSSDYQKSQWNTVCAGAGFSTAPYGLDLTIDAAVEFHTDVSPSIVLTTVYGF